MSYRPETKGRLWQTIAANHMEWMTKEDIDPKEWDAFVRTFNDAFADEVSELARIFWVNRIENGFEYPTEE